MAPGAGARGPRRPRALRTQPRTLQLHLHRPPGQKPQRVHLKIVRLGEPVPISDVLPMLENFGLRVISERPYELAWPEGGAAWIQDFELEHRDGDTASTSRTSRRTSATRFGAAWTGEIENDGFNRLLLAADLSAAADRGAARLLPLPAADRRALQPGVHGARAGRQCRHRAQPGAAVRDALRSGGGAGAAARASAPSRPSSRRSARALDAVSEPR